MSHKRFLYDSLVFQLDNIFKVRELVSPSIVRQIEGISQDVRQSKPLFGSEFVYSRQIDSVINGMFSLSSPFAEKYDKYHSMCVAAESISPIISNLNARNGFIYSGLDSNFRNLIKFQESITKSFGYSAFDEIVLPSDRVYNYMASLNTLIDFYTPSEMFVESALHLVDSYQAFVNKQCLYASQNVNMEERALKLVDSSGEILSSSQVAIELSLEQDDSDGDTDESIQEQKHELKANIFPMLNKHLAHIYRTDKITNIEDTLNNSVPAKVNHFGFSIVESIYKINSIYSKYNGHPVFKSTNKTSFGFGLLPSVVAVNEYQFAHLVDHLYFIMYEGSGSAKRLVDLVGRDQLDALWMLKRIRTYFRHDTEHDDETGKKLISIGNDFNFLVGKRSPTSAMDWKRAQICLYLKLFDMLSMVLENLEEAN